MTQLLNMLRNLGPMRLVAMGGVALLLFGFFFYVMTQISQPEMALLYDDLDARDSGAVVEQLEARDIPYQLRADGSSILVPADEVDRLRLAMAQEGIPSGGNLGYELFDDSDGFGTTTFVQNINRLRALEELARTISTITHVRQARVHLVLPERALFSRDTQSPTASVFLRLDSGGLTSRQVVAIQHLVSFAVPGLEPDQVSIVDDTGQLLASGSPEDGSLTGQSTAEERRRAEEARISQQIEQMLARSLGPGRVIARVAIEMDFDTVQTTSETYDPESQVARSTQFVESEESSSEADGVDPVSVSGNLPEAESADAGLGGAAGASSLATRTEETTNYEISRTVENRVRDGGRVERISVAVLVDGTYSEADDGTMTYTPRSDADMDQITALVQSAVGFDAVRGDTVEVVNMRFLLPDEMEPLAGPTTFFGFRTEEVMRLAELLILGVVAALVILLVVRPLLGRALEPAGQPALAGIDSRDDLSALLTDQSGFQAALAGPSAHTPAGGMPELVGAGGEDEEDMDSLIDIQQVEGRVRASSIKKIGEIVEAHPEEAVSIIRNWMYQDK